MLRDPLTHFVVLGALVFCAWQFLNPSSAGSDPRTIVVDRPSLLRFVQFRTRSFDESEAAKRLDGFSDAVFDDIVNEYIREEALHRAALDMGLDADDYVMRQRLVQKMEYMAEGVAEEVPEPDEATLKAYHAEHAFDYAQPPRLTFAHVFFSTGERDAAVARKLATDTLAELNGKHVPFAQATAWGERFTYHVNYVDRAPDEIAGHFGEAMTATLLTLQPMPETWQGPIDSPHGSHLVLLVRSEPATSPEFETVRDAVKRDWLSGHQKARKETFIERVVSGYTVIRAPDLRGDAGS